MVALDIYTVDYICKFLLPHDVSNIRTISREMNEVWKISYSGSIEILSIDGFYRYLNNVYHTACPYFIERYKDQNSVVINDAFLLEEWSSMHSFIFIKDIKMVFQRGRSLIQFIQEDAHNEYYPGYLIGDGLFPDQYKPIIDRIIRLMNKYSMFYTENYRSISIHTTGNTLPVKLVGARNVIKINDNQLEVFDENCKLRIIDTIELITNASIYKMSYHNDDKIKLYIMNGN